jgi:hypothetical protein
MYINFIEEEYLEEIYSKVGTKYETFIAQPKVLLML